MRKIVQKDDNVLRQKAKTVPVNEINGSKIKAIIEEMKTALLNEKDGVGLAAPQIGHSLRIFIIANNIGERNLHRKKPDTKFKNLKGIKPENLVYINPEIIKLSNEKKILDEGCLSVRPLFGKIERSVRTKIKAHDENGNMFERGASGLLAQIFQHEVDHLNGILFIDRATDIKEVVIEENTNEK